LVRGQVVVIRVYRWRRKGRIAGVLETADGARQTPFHNFYELRRAMGAVLIEDSSRTGSGRKS
jgi:hypothetical protein